MNRLALMIILGLLTSILAFIVSASIQDKAGSDDRAQNAISSITGGSYRAWINSPWSPSPEMEHVLFSLQAGIGGMLLGYFISFPQKRKSN